MLHVFSERPLRQREPHGTKRYKIASQRRRIFSRRSRASKQQDWQARWLNIWKRSVKLKSPLRCLSAAHESGCLVFVSCCFALPRRSLTCNTFQAALSFTTPPLIVLAGAVFWTRASDTLDAAEVFTIITIVIIAAKPYMTLLTSWSRWSTGLASLQRIQAFLCLDDIEDARRGPATPPDEATSTNDEKKPHRPPQPRATQFAVQFQAVALTSKIFGSLLKDVNLGINWGDLAIFWGSISSGKSTFLRCIIGEEKPDSGVVTVGTRAIAYSSQEPWLQNKSLRENVVGMYEFIESRYRNVLRCCQLDVDIASMNQGDLTVVGSNGTKLSGGQIQRVVSFCAFAFFYPI